MKKLFEGTNIRGMSLANRFIYSATWDGCADDSGFCTRRNIDMLVERVNGGVGLIITGMAYVKPVCPGSVRKARVACLAQ